MRLPMDAREVTLAWLNQALAQGGRRAGVASLRHGEFIGGAASKLRLHLEYTSDTQAQDLPPTMVLKACLQEGREALMSAGFYHREAYFYREIRDRYDVRAPRCYFAAEQQDPPQAVVLLEDLGGADTRFGSMLKPYSAAEVGSGLEALAQLHARSMGDPHVVDLPVPVAMEETRAIFDHILQIAGDRFSSPRGCAVAYVLHDVAKLTDAFHRYRQFVQQHAVHLLHGDAHPGNTYLQVDGTVCWLDWQLPARGHWIHDVAYFMAGALDIPDRRRHERELLRAYLDTARAIGAQMPSFEEAWLRYRQALVYGFTVWIGTDPAHQPESICTTGLSRFGAAMLDHDTYGLLGV